MFVPGANKAIRLTSTKTQKTVYKITSTCLRLQQPLLTKMDYLHTDDVAVVPGKWHVFDRVKEHIKYKGCQVAPAELEALLLTSNVMADYAFMGVYDELQVSEMLINE